MHTFQHPNFVHGALLDDYLAQGWYRMGQRLFTNDYIYLNKQWIRVFWLRFRLKDWSPSPTHRKILRHFQELNVRIVPFEFDEEKEALYQEYRTAIDFDGPEFATEFLLDTFPGIEPGHYTFDSRMVEMRQKSGDLLGLGIFDLGEKAGAGIISFFHPDLRKWSPGKFLMLKKIEYLKAQGFDYFYPGYMTWKYPKFNYKLFAGEAFAEIWDPFSRVWLPYSAELVDRLGTLQEIYFIPYIEEAEQRRKDAGF